MWQNFGLTWSRELTSAILQSAKKKVKDVSEYLMPTERAWQSEQKIYKNYVLKMSGSQVIAIVKSNQIQTSNLQTRS